MTDGTKDLTTAMGPEELFMNLMWSFGQMSSILPKTVLDFED